MEFEKKGYLKKNYYKNIFFLLFKKKKSNTFLSRLWVTVRVLILGLHLGVCENYAQETPAVGAGSWFDKSITFMRQRILFFDSLSILKSVATHLNGMPAMDRITESKKKIYKFVLFTCQAKSATTIDQLAYDTGKIIFRLRLCE